MDSTPALPPDNSLTFTHFSFPSHPSACFRRAMEGTTPETWHVALQDLEKGHVKVVLTVAILGVLDADFLFKIVSLVVERIDSLEAKVRDLEEGLGAESTDVDMAEGGGVAVNRAYFCRKLSTYTHSEKIMWAKEVHSNPEYFELSDDETVTMLLHPGVYHIQVPFGRAVGGVKLLLDSVSCGTKNRDTITHTEFTTQISYVEVYYGTTPETCHVALQDLENGYIQVVLTVAILGVLDEVFLFKMVPLAIDRIDVVEAKIRDLEESIANSSQGRNVSQEPEGEDAHDHVTEERGTVNRAYFSLKCTKATWKNELVVWTDDLYSDPEYFKWCDEDRAVITLVHPGVYQIQVTYQPTSGVVRLVLNGVQVSCTNSKLGDFRNCIAYTAFTTDRCGLQLYCSRSVDAGTTIQILLVSPLPVKCVATNIADHVTSGASYALPSDVVVTFLKVRGLSV
ncbi:hypothetical protein DYB37_009050 [Aphanomyces astaci]|uniref:Uncharacterized protein n=1 Tax=Aphanomyces astaci TaxID=112090 RepID=A0A3R6XXI2_APHAT|nr:hypothetical protein DYB37_009050 [Aphanomyces astaci]